MNKNEPLEKRAMTIEEVIQAYPEQVKQILLSKQTVTRAQLDAVWERHSYEVGTVRRMTQIGFMQAIQQLGIKIVG